MDSAAERLAQRYPPTDPRVRVVGIAALAVVVIAMLWWYLGASARLATPDVDAQIVSFEVVDEQHLDVTLQVSRADAAQPATCTVVASDAAGQAVGELEVPIPPAGATHVLHRTTVRTYAEATNAHLKACRSGTVPPR